ncbi:MAG: 3-isopropylmalate dehydrogenase [Thermomicrobiales bacterium]
MAKVALFPGDGVGPEVVAEAVKVLDVVSKQFDIDIAFEPLTIGGKALDKHGVPIRDEEIDACRGASAALLGAVGGPKWDSVDPALRPERGLLRMRKELGLFANLRPVSVLDALADASPLKREVVAGVDLLVLRELTGGLYYGQPKRQWREYRGRAAIDTLIYREHEIARVVRLGFALARSRTGRLASVDKSNVLTSSRLWRDIVNEIAPEYPDVSCEHVLVDAMSMHLIKNPARYDVIVTENMFGDILSDEASVIPGSIGLLPSASVSQREGVDQGTWFGLYEPIHGSAPDIAGQGKANPAGTILSAAMMLRWSLGRPDAAAAVEKAVKETIEAGVRTPDIATGEIAAVTTQEFGSEVASRISDGS